MQVIGTLIVVFILFILIYSLSSKSNTKSGAIMESFGKVAELGGKAANAASEGLKAKSIESDIKKIDLGGEFWPRFQNHNSLLIINVRFTYESFNKGELSDAQLKELIKNGENRDKLISNNIAQSEEFYKACKRLGVENVIVSGCMIYANNDRIHLKNSDLVKAYTVGNYMMEEK